jgi:predicted DNA-binding antitoxin AbrB/MazE fold protein
MTLEVTAVYEDGVLKPESPLPLREHQRVTVQVLPQTSRIRQTAALLKWTGDLETLRRIAEDPVVGEDDEDVP